jgi:hypothetical protein
MRFIIGFLIAIGILIFVFVLIFRGGGGEERRTVTPMVDYANTSTYMQYTHEGPINAEQAHDRIRITVSNQESSIEVFKGYQGNLVATRSYRNNALAYSDFLRGLELAGYRQGNPDKALADYRGFCPQGSRYVFSIKDGQSDTQQYWSTTCGGTQTFQGQTQIVRNLYLAQIPDYDEFISELEIDL